MKQKFLTVFGGLILSFTFNSLAAVDGVCLNKCTSNGYRHAYCQEACSYNNAKPEPVPQIGSPWDGFYDSQKQLNDIEKQKLENELLRQQIEQLKRENSS
jgi:hypothetical protein